MFRQFYRCRAEAGACAAGVWNLSGELYLNLACPGAVPHSLRQSDSKREGGGKKGTTGNINNKGARHVWRRIKAPRFLPANSIFSFSPACASTVNTEAA